jgi:8-oxo-dGTP pyrophosphatase MutT (NUDIX family)
METIRLWHGAVAICKNEHGHVLLVQIRSDRKDWALPGGGLKDGESPEDGCLREVREETGYDVTIQRRLCVKKHSSVSPAEFRLHVFEASWAGACVPGTDPDDEIEATGWFSYDDLGGLPFAFDEDKGLVRRYLAGESDLAASPWFHWHGSGSKG